MMITIQVSGIDSTDAIKQYANDKVADLEKYFPNIQKIDVDVGMRSGHHLKGKIYYAECNVSVPGRLVRVSKDAEDLYKAIDKVRDHLKVELEKIKGKMRGVDRDEIRESKGYQGE